MFASICLLQVNETLPDNPCQNPLWSMLSREAIKAPNFTHSLTHTQMDI